MVLTLSKVIIYSICIAFMVQPPVIASDMQLRISAGPFSKMIPCTMYNNNGSEVNLKVTGNAFFQTYGSDIHWAATTRAIHALLISLHKSTVDLRPMENLCYRYPLKSPQDFPHNEKFATIPSSSVVSTAQCAEWPKLENNADVTIQSNVDLVEYPNLAFEYISITEKLFAHEPELDVDLLSSSMSLVPTQQHILTNDMLVKQIKFPVKKTRKKSVPELGIVKANNAKNASRKTYAELFKHGLITDTIWHCVAPHLKAGSKCNKAIIEDRDFLEGVCKYELGCTNWTAVERYYNVKERVLLQKWTRWQRMYPGLVSLVKDVVKENEEFAVELSDALITESMWKNMAALLYEHTEKTSPIGNRVILELICQKFIHNSAWTKADMNLKGKGVVAGRGFIRAKWLSWQQKPEVVAIIDEVCQHYLQKH